METVTKAFVILFQLVAQSHKLGCKHKKIKLFFSFVLVSILLSKVVFTKMSGSCTCISTCTYHYGKIYFSVLDDETSLY